MNMMQRIVLSVLMLLLTASNNMNRVSALSSLSPSSSSSSNFFRQPAQQEQQQQYQQQHNRLPSFSNLQQASPAVKSMEEHKQELLHLLQHHNKNPEIMTLQSPLVEPAWNALQQSFETKQQQLSQAISSNIDARMHVPPSLSYNGVWEDYCPPAFPGGLGRHKVTGKPLYSISRLTFNRIPTTAAAAAASSTPPATKKKTAPAAAIEEDFSVVSIQKFTQIVDFLYNTGNNHEIVYDEGILKTVPAHLQTAVQTNPSLLRYQYLDTHVVSSCAEPLQLILRMNSFVYPSPTTKNFFESWFVGGTCLAKFTVPNNIDRYQQQLLAQDFCEQWKSIFPTSTSMTPDALMDALIQQQQQQIVTSPDSTTSVVVVEDTSLTYKLEKSISASNKILYLDETLRITQGNLGTVMVNIRTKQF